MPANDSIASHEPGYRFADVALEHIAPLKRRTVGPSDRIWRRSKAWALDNFPATDAVGYAVLADKVDFHSWSLLKGVAIATLLGVGSELTINGENDLIEAIGESTQQGVTRAGDQITSRDLDIQPTTTCGPEHWYASWSAAILS